MTTIQPDKKFGIIFGGSLDELKTEVAARLGPRPISSVFVNGYGAIHCDVWGTRDDFHKWMREDRRLTFFLGKG